MPEVRRSTVATIFAVVLAVALVTTFNIQEPDAIERSTWLITLAVWVGLSLVHALLTGYAFTGRAGADLAAAGRRVNPPRTGRRRTGWRTWPIVRHLFRVEDAPSFSVTLALCALVGVGGLALEADLRKSQALVAVGMVLVVVSWLNVVVMYALQYARMDNDGPERVFAFPGDDDERRFGDYFYIALGTQATFGMTDVAVLTTRARRIVTTQSLIAFIFNTVIVALIVSLLVTVA